jgi:hypothetical protein
MEIKDFSVGLIGLMFYLKVQKYIDIDKSTNFHVQQYTKGYCFYFFSLSTKTTNLSQVTDKHYHIMLLSSASIDWYLTPTLAVLQLYRGVNYLYK